MTLGKKQPPAVIGTQKLGAKIGADWGQFWRSLSDPRAEVKPQIYFGRMGIVDIWCASARKGKYLPAIQNIDRDYSNLAPTVHIIRRISDVYKDRVTPGIDQSGRI